MQDLAAWLWNITSDEGNVVQNKQKLSQRSTIIMKLGTFEFEKAGEHTITVSLVDVK